MSLRDLCLRRVVVAAALSISAGSAGVHSVSAAEYLLGPQDKIRLKIYEWQASKDTIFEWTALNDEFTVGADGKLSLPFAGEINAAGSAPGKLGSVIADQLMEHMGLGRAPDVSVEVVQFRPFYIVGEVRTPGEFPFRPGLTILQALSIAGGLRTREDNIPRLEREMISERGDIGVLAQAGLNLMARKARLVAELNGADDITFPDQLAKRSNEGSVALAMEQERLVFRARKDGMNTQIRAFNGLKDFLDKELSSLEEQVTLYDRQIELVQKELKGVSTLVDKGLSEAPRQMSLERALAQLRSDRLAAETAVFRARQEISRTDISILELSNQRATEVSQSLRETQAQINENSRKADTAMQMLRESQTAAPQLLALRTAAEETEPVYVVVRQTPDGKSTEIPATETTAVEPGDTVKVRIPLPPLGDNGLAFSVQYGDASEPPSVETGPAEAQNLTGGSQDAAASSNVQ